MDLWDMADNARYRMLLNCNVLERQGAVSPLVKTKNGLAEVISFFFLLIISAFPLLILHNSDIACRMSYLCIRKRMRAER
jgi:hypothetical protein